MIKAAIYCRVSTEGQEQDGTSLQTQLEACLKYCRDKQYEVYNQYLEAWSGLSLERPKLNELRDLVRRNIFDVLVVYSLDRLSRDPVHGVIIMQELEKYGVSLQAVSETVDNSEVGKLVFYIKGYAAKLDAERRRDATGRGKKAILKAGKLPQGTGIGIYGYTWVKDEKRRVPLEPEAKVVQRMFEKVANGTSHFKLARMLNQEGILTKAGKKWEASTVSRIVNNSSYCGLTYFGRTSNRKSIKREDWVLLKDVTPAIISRELFDKAQNVIAKSRELHPGKALHEYPLTGFLVCGNCGSPLVGSCLRGNYRYYICCGTYNTASREKICNSHYIRADWLENVVWEKVKEVLSEPELLLEEVSKQAETEKLKDSNGNLENEIKLLTRKLNGYKAQERRLMNAFKLGFSDDVILDEFNKTKREKEVDQIRLDSLIQTKANLEKMVNNELNLKELCSRIVSDLDNCTNEDKKDAYTYLDLKVTVTQEGVDIKGYLHPKLLIAEQSSG